MRRITKIKNLSENRRLPRLGKVRGGIKVEKDGKTFPKETPWFVVPREVSDKLGTDKPTEIEIMIPVEDDNVSFPQAMEMYGSGKGLKCTGDGEIAYRLNEETRAMEQRTCPCEFSERKILSNGTSAPGPCKQRAHLLFIIPKVSMGGVYQFDTSSFNSIVDINSSLDYVRSLVGRVSMVPLKLKREARETHHDNKKQIHYTVRIEYEGDIDSINNLRSNNTFILSKPQFSLPPPVQENPELDDETAVVTEASDPAPMAVAVTASQGDVHTVLMFTKESLLNMLGVAKEADAVNHVLDLSNSLKVAEDKVAIRKAAAKRMQELIQR